MVTIRSRDGIARRQRVEECGLARTGAARDQDVPARTDHPLEERRGVRAEPEGVEGDRPGAEAPDGDARAVDRERRDHRVEARAVGETGVDHRRGTVEPQPERRHDPLDESHDRGGVEVEGNGLELPVPLHVGRDRGR